MQMFSETSDKVKSYFHLSGNRKYEIRVFEDNSNFTISLFLNGECVKTIHTDLAAKL